MTQIKADNITNVAGTGAPDFADGVTVAGGSAISSLNLAEAYSQGTEPSSPKNGALWWDTGNDKLYAYIASEWKEIELGASTATWFADLSGFSYDSVSFSTTSQVPNLVGLVFKPDGTKMYATGGNGTTSTNRVYEYSLPTAWDITTASYTGNFYIGSQMTYSFGFDFKPDGTKMYVHSYTSDRLYQYSLSTAWDVTTASYDNKYYTTTAGVSMFCLKFNTDGDKFFMLSNGGSGLYEYNMSTAWDVSTASAGNTFDPTGINNHIGFAFSPDGLKLYVTENVTDALHQYSLSTPFDITTASSDSSSASVSQADNPRDIAFSADGTKMYICNYTDDTIYQYSTGL